MVSQTLKPLTGEQDSSDPPAVSREKQSEYVRPRGLWPKAVVVGIS